MVERIVTLAKVDEALTECSVRIRDARTNDPDYLELLQGYVDQFLDDRLMLTEDQP